MSRPSKSPQRQFLEPQSGTRAPEQLLVTEQARKLLPPNITSVPRSSELLQRVADFLPKMEQAEKDLKKKLETEPASSFEIETLQNEEDPHIEMNLELIPDQDEEQIETDLDLPQAIKLPNATDSDECTLKEINVPHKVSKK